jgi:hypothetical protein
MRIRRYLYGWLGRHGECCLGRNPPDSPMMPYKVYSSMQEAEEAARAKRYQIIWCGAAAKMQPQVLPSELRPL